MQAASRQEESTRGMLRATKPAPRRSASQLAQENFQSLGVIARGYRGCGGARIRQPGHSDCREAPRRCGARC